MMRKLDIAGTARASFYLYNDPEDIDRLVAALAGVRRIFG
jgi:cysteine desulfurase/selenocysteine lyase